MDRRSLLAALSALIATPAFAQSRPPQPAQARDRATMARVLARVQPGMSRAQVRAITGAPDDVLTRLDAALQPTTIVTELWSYGAGAHGAFPSLGSVGFDARGAVFMVHGASSSALAPLAASVAQQRSTFELLSRLSGLEGHSFDPAPLVRAVNALVPLGKSLALELVTEYLRLAPPWMSLDTQGVFLLLRALFERSPGAHPPMAVGAPDVSQAAIAASGFPMFPLAIVSDVPVLLVSGYMLGGMPEQPEAHLPWYRANGVLRSAPLAPAISSFASQLDRTRILGLDAAPAGASARRAMLLAQVTRAGAAASPAPLARRVSHSTAVPGASIEALLERRGAAVRVWVHPTRAAGAFATTIVSFVAAGATLQRFELSPASLGSYSVGEFSHPAGQPLVVRVERGGRAIASPTLVP
jgi:hypothetical protein